MTKFTVGPINARKASSMRVKLDRNAPEAKARCWADPVSKPRRTCRAGHSRPEKRRTTTRSLNGDFALTRIVSILLEIAGTELEGNHLNHHIRSQSR
jgi:hypothetical protein